MSKQTCKRGQKGVGIILSPELTKYYKDAGSIPPVTPTNETSMEFGRFICLKIKVDITCKEKGAFRKKKKKIKASQLIYIYPPFITQSNSKINSFFNEYLASLYCEIPSTCKMISGQDMNASIGSMV